MKPYPCPHCSYRSARSDDLAKHVSRHARDGVKELRCPRDGCAYVTTDHVAYRQHKAGHSAADAADEAVLSLAAMPSVPIALPSS